MDTYEAPQQKRVSQMEEAYEKLCVDETSNMSTKKNGGRLHFMNYIWIYTNHAYSYKKSIRAMITCFAMRLPKMRFASFENMIRVRTMTVLFFL